MTRKAILLLATAGAIWLTSFGFMESSGQEAAKMKAALPKAARAPKKAETPVGALWDEAARVLGQGAQAAREMARDDPQVQQFEQQYGAQFRQLYKSELHFLRVVCQPTKQEYERISAESAPVLKAIVRKFALGMRDHQRFGLIAGPKLSDPRTLITDRLVTSVRANLSPEQAARYQTELDQRSAARKRAIVLSTLAKLDKTLLLTAEQRGKLGEILDKDVKTSWQQLQLVMYGDRSFPALPEHKLLSLLNETQKKVWRNLPRENIGIGFDLGIVQGIDIEDEVWDDERPVETPHRTDAKAAVNGTGTAKPEEKK
jgi:hypothetical protein